MSTIWSNQAEQPLTRNQKIVTGLVLAGIGVWFARNWIGVEKPGHWYEKSHYNAQVMVRLATDNGKVYTVPGDIEREGDCDSDGESSSCYSWYRVKLVHFSNGGYVTFEDCHVSTLNDAEYCTASNDTDRTFKVSITDDVIAH
jgi:hypothetical protein